MNILCLAPNLIVRSYNQYTEIDDIIIYDDGIILLILKKSIKIPKDINRDFIYVNEIQSIVASLN